jgi:signal transduction histidine kinase
MLGQATYDAFVVDVMLPDGSGMELLNSILDQDSEAVCIIITGFSSVEMAVEAVRQGAFDFLSKPFTSDELLVAVARGIETRRLRAVEAQAASLSLAKEELEKLDQIKSQLMLRVAHELRAPVAAVQSYINLFQMGYLSQDEVDETLARIQERLQGMLDLTADLLELAQLKQLRLTESSDSSPVDMAEVLEETFDFLSELARQKEVELRLEVRSRPVIAASKKHLGQLWMNLISNAIKYSRAGGQVYIELHETQDSLIGSVQDSGIGISQEDQAHLFQEFFRTDQARASEQTGTGLGLSIVKEILDSYGGQISVDSQPGHGSRFTFTMPLHPPSHVQADVISSLDTSQQSRPASRPPLPKHRAQPTILGSDPAKEA